MGTNTQCEQTVIADVTALSLCLRCEQVVTQVELQIRASADQLCV